jgi:hypothetical protein
MKNLPIEYRSKMNDALSDIANEVQRMKDKEPEHIKDGGKWIGDLVFDIGWYSSDDSMERQRRVVTAAAARLTIFLTELM